MTKEEAIENIKLIRFNAAITNAKSFKEALDMAIEALSQPSIPSNLDEAAEKYANMGISSNADPYEETMSYQANKNAFKAGAEWLSNQGVSADSEIHKKLCIVTPEPELSEFEYAMLRYAQDGFNAADDNELVDITKKHSTELLDIAKKEALNGLPRWRRAEKPTDIENLKDVAIIKYYIDYTSFREIDGKLLPSALYLTEADLAKLPKED